MAKLKVKVKKLFEVTITEKYGGCQRTVRVAASNFGEAASRAVKANPDELWQPKAVKVELIGKVY